MEIVIAGLVGSAIGTFVTMAFTWWRRRNMQGVVPRQGAIFDDEALWRLNEITRKVQTWDGD